MALTKTLTAHQISTAVRDERGTVTVIPVFKKSTEVPCRTSLDVPVRSVFGELQFKAEIIEGDSLVLEDCSKLGELLFGGSFKGRAPDNKASLTFELNEHSVLRATMNCAGQEGHAELRASCVVQQDRTEQISTEGGPAGQ